MESMAEKNERHEKSDDEKDELFDLRVQLMGLMRACPLEEEKMENLKALSEKYVVKLSTEILDTDGIDIQIMKKLGMYSHKANNQPLDEFNAWFQDVLKNSSSETDKPIERFTVSLTGHPVCSPELETFTTLCGPNIKHLQLQISDLEIKGQGSESVNYFFTVVRMLLENAERLTLKLADRQNDKNYMTTAYIFKSIFSNRPALTNLKRLRLSLTRSIDFALLEKFPALQRLALRAVFDGNDPGEFPNLFTHLSGSRRIQSQTNPEFLNLKTLDIIGVPKDSLRSLKTADLSLEHLALSLTCLVTEDELRACLHEFRVTLKSLKLLRCKIRSCTPLSLTPLSVDFVNLTELELWGNVVTRLEFRVDMPNLVKLRMDFYCFDCSYYSGNVIDGPNVFQGDVVRNSSDMKGRRSHLFPKLQEFVTDCRLSTLSWFELGIWMRSLRVLEARIPNNVTLWDLCDALRMLRKLRLRFGSDIDDDGIVGGAIEEEYGGSDRDVTYSRGITKLEHLRFFELEVECGQGKLTDKSAVWGFLKLEHLETLMLGFTGNSLTEEMEMRLREKIDYVEVYRSCSKTTPGEKVERCCEWADFKRDWNVD